jgi:hypothetical protein
VRKYQNGNNTIARYPNSATRDDNFSGFLALVESIYLQHQNIKHNHQVNLKASKIDFIHEPP